MVLGEFLQSVGFPNLPKLGFSKGSSKQTLVFRLDAVKDLQTVDLHILKAIYK